MRTIGKFYKEEILCLPKKKLKKVEFEIYSSDIKIEEDLFGWKLYSGKEYMECRSEEEARYLRIFLDAGVREVYVPKDDEYLKEILPKFEKLKKKIDEIIDSYLYSVLDRNLRARARHEIYMEITK